MRAEVKRQLKFKRDIARAAKADKAEDTAEEYDHTHYVSNMLKQGESLYDVVYMITLIRPTYDSLMDSRRELIDRLETEGLKLYSANARQEEALLSTLPGMWPSKVIWNKGRRNHLTSSLSASYMFFANEFNDSHGIILGRTTSGALFKFNPFDTDRHQNASLFITGSPGSGKTFTTQILARRMRMLGHRIMMILPIKGYEYARGCAAIGGEFIQLKPGAETCINIFDVNPVDDESSRLIDEDSLVEEKILTVSMNRVINVIDFLMGDDKTTIVEKRLVGNLLLKMYEKFGITMDNDSIYEEVDGQRQIKKMPTASDFMVYLKAEPRLKRIATVFAEFTEGKSKNMDGQTNVNLQNKYICFDVSQTPKDLLAVYMYIAIDLVESKMKENRTETGLAIIDEAWRCMVGSGSVGAAESILSMAKVLRGYGAGLIICTQELRDLVESTGGYGRAIINAAKTKLILNSGEEDAERIAKLLRLTEDEAAQLTKFEKGKGLLLTSDEKAVVKIIKTDKDEDDFTTDVNRLRIIAERNRQRREAEQQQA